MKRALRYLLILLILAAAAVGLIFAFLEKGKMRAREAEGEAPVSGKSRVTVGTNGEMMVTLDEPTQKLIALRVEPAMPAKMSRERQGYGRVVDPAPLAALAAEVATAQAALVASQKECDRLKVLNAEKNASDRALQAAEATARRDQILGESACARLELAWGKSMAERASQPAFLRSLTSLESVIVRLDLPLGDTVAASPTGARIVVAAEEGRGVPGEFLGPVRAADPQIQGQGFLFLVKEAGARLVPGTAVSGFLSLPGEPEAGWVVPSSCVVRQAAQGWIFVQASVDTFVRRRISLEHPTEGGWFVREGIATSDRVVVSGAQALLSEEQKSRIKLLE